MRSPLLLIPLLGGCQYLEEIRENPTAVSWQGYVLADLSTAEEAQLLSDGAVELLDLEGEPLAAGRQLYSGSPGYWSFAEDDESDERVPVQTEVAVRVSGPGLDTMLWRGRTPDGSGYWQTGALFARDTATHDAFFEAIEGALIAPLSEGTVAHLWGEPLAPDEWAGATIVVTDGGGASADVLRLAYAEDGTLAEAGDGPVDIFLAFNLAPGDVTLDVTAPDGRSASTTWPASGGEMVSAVFYALPESP